MALVIWNLRDNTEWLTTTELATRFGVTIWTIYKWRERYGLTTVRIDGVDHSPVPEAATIDRATEDETRGAPRLDAAAA